VPHTRAAHAGTQARRLQAGVQCKPERTPHAGRGLQASWELGSWGRNTACMCLACSERRPLLLACAERRLLPL